MKHRVLFLCTHNSARSQMAEGILRGIAGDRFEVSSAGTEKTRVHPLAVTVMREIGIDISRHTSKTVDEFLPERLDFVITVCDRANDNCPIFPGLGHRIHWSFEDPSAAAGSEEQQLRVFRKVRDEILERLRTFAGAGEHQDVRNHQVGTESKEIARGAAARLRRPAGSKSTRR